MWSCYSTLGIYPIEMKTNIHTKVCVQVFDSHHNWQPRKCALCREWASTPCEMSQQQPGVKRRQMRLQWWASQVLWRVRGLAQKAARHSSLLMTLWKRCRFSCCTQAHGCQAVHGDRGWLWSGLRRNLGVLEVFCLSAAVVFVWPHVLVRTHKPLHEKGADFYCMSSNLIYSSHPNKNKQKSPVNRSKG